MELAEIDDADADERANRRKRDALRGDKPVQFSMFDPVVAYDAISNNWINVAEVAKLGIQAAHKKLSVAREERVELQISLDNMRQQLRGMQEHHVQQMDILKIRLEILEKIAKRKKKYRNGKVPTTEQLEHLPNKLRSRGGERETLGGRGPPSKDPRASAALRFSGKPARGSDRRTQGRDSLSHFLSQEEDGSSSDDSSVRGVTQDQQQLLEKIEPMRNLIDELKTSLRKESQKSDALHKQIVKGQHHQDQLENRMNDELSTRALSLLFRQVVFTDLPAMLETFVQDKFQVFRKTTDSLERKVEAEVGHRKQVVETMDKKLGALISRVASTEEGIQSLAAKFSSQESSNLSEAEDPSPYAAASSQSYREALLSRSDLHPDLQPELSEGIETQLFDLQQGAGAEGNVAQDSLAEDTAQLAQAADDVTRRASLPLPIPARHVPSTSNSHDQSQGTEQSGAGEGSRTGTLEEIALPRTLDRSESHFSPSEHFWGPPSMEDPEVDHPRAGLSDESSSRFFPRNKSRTSAEGSSHASPKSTKNRDGASTRRRSAARMEKAVTRKQTEDVNDDLSPTSSLNMSHITEGGGRSARRTSRLVQKAEDALSALFRMKGGGKDGGDKSMSLDDFTTNMANMSTMQDTLKAQKEDGDRLHEEVSDLSSRLGALEETVKKLAESVSQVRELSDLRQQENQSRLSNVEGRSDGEFQRVIKLAEDRVMAFLRESEMERARLWHQMAVLFPRFIQNDEDGAEKMTLTEARMFALDVRLDTLEGGIVRLLARDPDCMPKPRKRHTRRIQPDPENGGIKRSWSPQQPKRCSTPGTNRSPSPLQQKRGGTPGDDGDCATRASVSPSSSPEPRPLQLPTLDQVAKPGSHSKLRELLAMQQELVHQVSGGDAGPGPSDRRASAVQGSELLARIAAIPEDPEWQNVRHPPSRESLEGAVLDVLEEARSAYDDAAEAMRSLGSAHPNSGRWRAGDAAVGRVLEQEQGINNQSAKQRKAFQPWSPPYRPFRPLDHLRNSS